MAKSNKPSGAKGASANAPVPPKTPADNKSIEAKIQDVFESSPGVNEVWHDGEDVYLSCRYANCIKITR